MCDCVNVDCGSYDNQTTLEAPPHMKNRKISDCFSVRETISIDTCIVDEVKLLWDMGITTVGSCCGHNKPIGYIQVLSADDEKKMLELGYLVDPGAKGSFFSKQTNNEGPEDKLRGHDIVFVADEWLYKDTGLPTVGDERSCGYCGENNTKDGHDGCIGELPNVMNACCGHGIKAEAYIQHLDGNCIRGDEAIKEMGLNLERIKNVSTSK